MASLSRSSISAQQPEGADNVAEVPEAVFCAEKFLASLFDPEAQQEMCSDRMTVEWLHSWVRNTFPMAARTSLFTFRTSRYFLANF